MEKTIGAFEVRRKLGKVLQEVSAKGDKYIIERHGEEVAVVVPVEVYKQWKQDRDKFFEELREIQSEADMPPEEADALVDEVVRTVRAEKAEQ